MPSCNRTLRDQRQRQAPHLATAIGGFLPAALLPATLAAGLILGPPDATAGDVWNVRVDVAAARESAYPGSDEHQVMGFPGLEITRESGTSTWFVSLPWRGIGVTTVDPGTGLTTTLSANLGTRRSTDEYSVLGIPIELDERTRAFLAGSPTVSTPVTLQAALEYPTRLGVLSASLSYHPTTVEAAGSGQTSRNGFLARLQFSRPLLVSSRLAIVGQASVQVMDPAYADAWFSVDQATETLETFDAGAGVRDAQAVVHARYQATERVTVGLLWRSLLLLGDAAASPYTRDRLQETVVLRTSYAF
jgi:outer membrane scaffolding protein for murein synthesis (MipA/OmpV family)